MIILKNILKIIAIFIAINLSLTSFFMASAVLEGKTGYWSPYWKYQAELILKVLD